MGVNAGGLHMGSMFESLRQRFGLLKSPQTDSAHAGVQLDVDQCVPALLFRFFFQNFHHFRGKDGLGQVVADAFLRRFLHGGTQHQNFAGNAAFPQLHAFLRQRYGEMLRSHGMKGGGDGNHAVPVGVGLDDRHDLRFPGQKALL